ncbi:MAG: hypothetical protein KatS3mg105_4860 [Gemmatales bacterium]|nr:MAG: hypothetical protein KatS3mg105_4860 [Gemmatales bacterium]
MSDDKTNTSDSENWQEITKAPEQKTKKRGMSAERIAVEVGRLDKAHVVVVLVFAFLSGSYAAENSDVYRSLAVGRLIAAGEFPFGHDPFAFTTEGTRWVHHAWFADWMQYVVYTLLGDGTLVALKALLLVATTALLLAIRDREQSIWLPALAAIAAVLTLCPGWELRPACFSGLFLAVTLFLLAAPLDSRQQVGNSAIGRFLHSPKRVFLLLPLFVLWANCDRWFLLGPITVALFCLGESLQRIFHGHVVRSKSANAFSGRDLLVVAGGGLLVCLISPYHVFGLRLPPELVAKLGSSKVADDPWFADQLLSAFRRERLLSSPAEFAIVPFALLGFLSFVVDTSGWRWWRGLLWLFFFFLAAELAPTAPFFAIVAGPIIVLNFQDAASRRASGGPYTKANLTARMATFTGLVALSVLAWPGWLQGSNRRVAWSIAMEPGLRGLAEELALLKKQGKLRPDDRGFNFNLRLAPYLAWISPGERYFIDDRFHLYPPEVLASFREARQALELKPGQKREPVAIGQEYWTGWRTIFSRYEINHLIIGASQASELEELLVPLWADPKRWTTMFTNGRSAILYWHGEVGDTGERKRTLRFPFQSLAFGEDLPALWQAPAEGAPPPRAVAPLDRFLMGPKNRPLAVDQGEIFLGFHRALVAQQEEDARKGAYLAIAANRRFVQPASYVLSSVMQPIAACAGELSRTVREQILPDAFWQRMFVIRQTGQVAPALPLMALRAARRAVAENPNDFAGHLLLARATLIVWTQQRIHVPRSRYPFLNEIRQVQIAAALNNALKLKPDSAVAHQQLAELYFDSRVHDGVTETYSHFDLAIEHWFKGMELARQEGPLKNETEEDFSKRMDALKRVAEHRLQQFIGTQLAAGRLDRRSLTEESRQNPQAFLKAWTENFELATANLPLSNKVNQALMWGLAGKALELLQKPDQKLSRNDAMQLFQLLVKSGRIEEVRAAKVITDPHLNVLLSAAAGDYARVDGYLAQLVDSGRRERVDSLLNLSRGLSVQTIVQPRSLFALAGQVLSLRDEANLLTVQGLFALEQGNNAKARAYFRQALQVVGPDRRQMEAFYFDYKPLARFYLAELQAANRVTADP